MRFTRRLTYDRGHRTLARPAAGWWLVLLAAAPLAAGAAGFEPMPCATPDARGAVGVGAPMTPRLAPAGLEALGMGFPADCAFDASNPSAVYEPTFLFTVTVVVHVIQDGSCTNGALTDEQVESQIAILNEDFQALPGTNGAAGNYSGIRFVLATEDPDGLPTTGITRTCNTTWYNDDGTYYDSLAWDPVHYLNLYTSSASGARGYVPFLPAEGGGSMVGSNADRVVINHLAVGRDGPFPPHHQGRTATHEIGHFLGLFHPYLNGCGTATAPECYATGDLLCDTPPDAASHGDCQVGATSCGGVPVPIENYMELTDDLCLTEFTPEQVRRMRCTLTHYRPDLAQVQALTDVFSDGFETGDASAWSAQVP